MQSTGGCSDLADFEEFVREIERTVQKYADAGLGLKVERDPESSLVKVFGPGASGHARAKNGLYDVSELAHTAAEHHPYWVLLDNSAEIASIILAKWQSDLSESDLDDIKWHIDSLAKSLARLKSG